MAASSTDPRFVFECVSPRQAIFDTVNAPSNEAGKFLCWAGPHFSGKRRASAERFYIIIIIITYSSLEDAQLFLDYKGVLNN